MSSSLKPAGPTLYHSFSGRAATAVHPKLDDAVVVGVAVCVGIEAVEAGAGACFIKGFGKVWLALYPEGRFRLRTMKHIVRKLAAVSSLAAVWLRNAKIIVCGYGCVQLKRERKGRKRVQSSCFHFMDCNQQRNR